MAAKAWDDQPDEVEHAFVLATMYLKDIGLVEVRQADLGGYFVTVGNLFGSQTIVAPTADKAFLVLDSLNKPPKKRELPSGCSLYTKKG